MGLGVQDVYATDGAVRRLYDDYRKKREPASTCKDSSFILQIILLNPEAVWPLRMFTLSLLFVGMLLAAKCNTFN